MFGASAFMRLFRSIFREQKTRLKIDWLTHTDEQILKHLATVDQDDPETIATDIDRSVEYVSDRCRQLGLRGLLEPIEERSGVSYRLSNLGERYLHDEIEAEELEELAG